ncbi:MAG: hypothetical protein ACRC9L_09130 [Brevinema sp.]
MFSLSHLIRIFIMISIVVMVAFFSSLTAIDVFMEPYWASLPPSIEQNFRHIYISMIIITLSTAVFGVVTFIFFYNRGLNKYQDLIRRMSAINFGGRTRPNLLRFPNEDEFGNLGTHLNALMEKLSFYNESKTNIAQIEQEKFFLIAKNAHFPILILNTRPLEPIVSYYNQAFKEIFLKRSVFIDHSGKTQTRYYNLDEAPLSMLKVRTPDGPNFFDDRQSSWIRNPDLSGSEIIQTLRNIKFRSLNGEKSYVFGEVLFFPVYNKAEQTVTQILYIFLNPKLDERLVPKVNTALGPII